MPKHDAITALEEAKCMEQEGQAFYRKAAQQTRDEKGRQVFLSLVADEVHHERLIQRELDSLVQAGEWTPLPDVSPASCDLTEPIFPQGRAGLAKAVEADAGESEALLVALEMENNSYDLYRRRAAASTNTAERTMYEFFADQERNHFDLLMSNYQSMVSWGGWED
jgi:rubrerythrin